MQICRRWRAIARDTPVLWCRIHLYIPWAANPRSCQLAERRGSALQVWIERSKSLPLRLALSDNQAAVATTLLQPHIHRLQSLCQNLDQENNETFLLKDTSVQFPLLKSLVITSQDDVLEALYDSSLSARVPNIEAVTFAGPFHSPFRLHLNWGKITTFHWKPFRANGSLSNEEALRLLQSMPSLQVCRIEQFRTLTATHDGANTLRVIRLPHLRTLHLHQIEGGPMTVDILNHINAPLLNDLSVHFFEPIPLHSSPINFQPIRRLDMGVGTLPSTHIIELLSSLHSVEDLTFKFQSEPNWFFDNNLSEEEKDTRWRSYGFSDSVLKALTPTSDHTACAPRLRTLAVYNPLWLPSSLTTEAFMAFLVERKRHLDVQLTRITLPSPAYVQGLQDALKQWDEADNGPLIQELLFSNDSEEPRPEPFYPLVTLMQLPEEW
ncbi:hypothetical protein CC2G_007931 [Coprinopsis cinerea AmutBmut pab1-1]|nr:hypothetical protein CC2G_007931 [Coprinopsis cinerea AmutBmut pab1-1]